MHDGRAVLFAVAELLVVLLGPVCTVYRHASSTCSTSEPRTYCQLLLNLIVSRVRRHLFQLHKSASVYCLHGIRIFLICDEFSVQLN